MSHSPELIKSIVTLLKADYPSNEYQYVIERAIPETRMYPDVQIYDQANALICVAEIGYTRPEKLTAYREDLKIPDVRWYDKSGRLHADVEERVVRVRVETEPLGKFSVYRTPTPVQCTSEDCETEAANEWNYWMRSILEPMTESEEFETWDELLNFLSEEVATLVITDTSRIWICSYCDRCGARFASEENDSIDTWSIVDDVRDLSERQLQRNWGHKRKYRGDWAGAVAFVEEYLGMTPQYQDGGFLTPEAKRDFNLAMTAIRVQAIQT